MKRGIPIALQAAGAVLACLVTTLNCSPVRSLVKGHAIRCYYNEDGKLIYRDTLATSARTYVIRTSQTKTQMYADYFSRYKDTKIEDSTIAKIVPITKEKAMQVEKLLEKGNTKDSLVRSNIIPIETPEFFLKIWKWIPDTGKGIDPEKDFREYGGFIKKNREVTHEKADPIMDACEGNAAIAIDPNGKKILGFYHTHPSGEKQNGVCGFTQAPSHGDQNNSHVIYMNYVFGMKSHRVYILNKEGVHATIPFCFFLPCD